MQDRRFYDFLHRQIVVLIVLSLFPGLGYLLLGWLNGVFLPAASRVHPVYRTPHVAIIVYALLSWILAITGAFKYLLAIFVIARMLVYGSTAAALIVLRRREGPAPVAIPGGTVVSLLALAACAALVATQSFQAVRDVVIVLAIGFAVRAVVRGRADRVPPKP